MTRLGVNSLAQRIFIYVGLTMLTATLIIVSIMTVEFRDHVNSFQNQSLKVQAQDIAKHLKVTTAGELQLALPSALIAVYRSESEANQYVVMDESGNVLFASREWSQELIKTRVSADAKFSAFNYADHEGEHAFNAISYRLGLQASNYYIQVARQRGKEFSVDSVLKEFLDEIIWVMLILFAIILMVMYWTVRSVLKPLKAVSEQASAIAPNRFDLRLPTRNIPTEVLPMVQAMNKALDRLQEGYRIQQEFTANAAHEIRTPLAILRAHIESSKSNSDSRELLPDLARLERIVGQLLNLAQMDNLVLEDASIVNLHDLAVDCASRLAPMSIRHGKQLAVTGERDVVVTANEAILGSAIRNLLENAIFYTGEASDIEITIDTTPAISILDRGPGIAESDQENLFKRFWRDATSRHGGAGLGLSIVVMIAEAHQAQVSVANREGGGAKFTIAFPNSSATDP